MCHDAEPLAGTCRSVAIVLPHYLRFVLVLPSFLSSAPAPPPLFYSFTSLITYRGLLEFMLVLHVLFSFQLFSRSGFLLWSHLTSVFWSIVGWLLVCGFCSVCSCFCSVLLCRGRCYFLRLVVTSCHMTHMSCRSYVHSENTDSRDGDFKVSRFICQYHQEAHKLICDHKETSQSTYVNIYNIESFYAHFNLMCNIKLDIDANTIRLFGHVMWRHYSQALGSYLIAFVLV